MDAMRFNPNHRLNPKFIDIKRADVEAIVKEVNRLTKIPSPTFHEEGRAQYVLKRLKAMGIKQIQMIGHNNVIAAIGKGKGPLLLLAAHLDTVFPAETNIKISRKRGVLIGPGVGDNAIAIAAGLHLLERLKKYMVEPIGTLVFAASTCEEGSGNLRGITEIIDFLKQRIDYALALEGLFQGRLAYQAIGSERWEVHYQGLGGHSWENAGAPNPNHALVKFGYFLLSLKLPPMTTLNLSIIEGGRSINSISTSAKISIDIRSLTQANVRNLLSILKDRAKEIGKSEKLRLELIPLGKRPAGCIRRNHQLVQLGRQVHKHLGIESEFTPMSTDANIPLARGIPSLAIGISRGGNCHREDEFIEISSIASGLKQLIHFVNGLVGMEGLEKF